MKGRAQVGRNEASAKGLVRSKMGISPTLKKVHFWAYLFLAAHNSRILNASLGGNGGEGSCRLSESNIHDEPGDVSHPKRWFN